MSMILTGWLSLGVASHGGNATLVVLSLGHLDVSSLSPDSAPRVLDNPVVLASLATVSNSQDTMVERVAGAVGLVVDTAGVQLEGVVGSVDGNGDRDHSNSLLKVTLVTEVVGGVSAVRLGHLVGVGLLSVDSTVLEDVLEGDVGVAAVAGVVVGVTVHQVLLGEGDEVARGNGVSALDSSDGGESPAGAALALVLDRGDSAIISPVHGQRGLDIGKVSSLHALDRPESGVEVDKLVVGQISKLVDAQPVGVFACLVLSVVLLDQGQVLGKDSFALIVVGC